MSMDLSRQRALLRDQYRTMLHCRTTGNVQFTALLFQFLLLPQHGRFTQFFSNLLKNSLECQPDWQPEEAARALEHLETYALNLYSFPWRNEFKTIKLYTGFYRLKLALYIQDADRVLGLMGYVRRPDNVTVLTLRESVDRDQLLEIAFSLRLLQVECDVYRSVYDRVRQHGYTMSQVHECRCIVGGSVDECERWIRDRYGHTRKPVDGRRVTETDSNPWTRTVTQDRRSVGGSVDECERWIRDRYGHTRKPVDGRRVTETDSNPWTRTVTQDRRQVEPLTCSRAQNHAKADVLARRRGYLPVGENRTGLVARSEGTATNQSVDAWIDDIPVDAMSLYDVPRRAPLTSWTDDDDIYTPRTAQEHQMRSVKAMRTPTASLPMKPRVQAHQHLYVELPRTSYGNHNTFGGVASLSMGNHTDAQDCSYTSPFPRSLTDDPCQHSDLLTRTSRSREPVNLRADYGMRTQPCAVAASRDSFYDNVDCLMDVSSQGACPSSEPYISRQAHTATKIGPVKRENEMTLL